MLLAAGLVLSALIGQLSVLGSGPIVPVVVVYAAVGFVVGRRTAVTRGTGELDDRR